MSFKTHHGPLKFTLSQHTVPSAGRVAEEEVKNGLIVSIKIYLLCALAHEEDGHLQGRLSKAE